MISFYCVLCTCIRKCAFYIEKRTTQTKITMHEQSFFFNLLFKAIQSWEFEKNLNLMNAINIKKEKLGSYKK